MHPRRLVTTEKIIAIASPNSDDVLEALHEWTREHDVALETVAVGEDIDGLYDKGRDTLGVTLGGDGTFLEGVQAFAPRDIPMLGVNTGTLTFLPRIKPADIQEHLLRCFAGRRPSRPATASSFLLGPTGLMRLVLTT